MPIFLLGLAGVRALMLFIFKYKLNVFIIIKLSCNN